MATIKPKAKVKSKADQYDSKLLPKPGKQTPSDFMPKSYDTRFKPVKGGGVNTNGPSVGPREKTPGGGFSRNGSKIKKAKNGGAFGMLSVKAGIDKNPNPTAADRIAGATKKAKSGTKMKKAMMGTTMMDAPMMNTPMMKKGGTMKKCKYGCK